MTIHIDSLEFETIIGILENERITPQKVNVKCSAQYQHEKSSFIDYALVTRIIVKTMQNEKFELIETALETLSTVLKSRFPQIDKLYLRIDKPDILANCTVGVSMEYTYDTM